MPGAGLAPAETIPTGRLKKELGIADRAARETLACLLGRGVLAHTGLMYVIGGEGIGPRADAVPPVLRAVAGQVAAVPLGMSILIGAIGARVPFSMTSVKFAFAWLIGAGVLERRGMREYVVCPRPTRAGSPPISARRRARPQAGVPAGIACAERRRDPDSVRPGATRVALTEPMPVSSCFTSASRIEREPFARVSTNGLPSLGACVKQPVKWSALQRVVDLRSRPLVQRAPELKLVLEAARRDRPGSLCEPARPSGVPGDLLGGVSRRRSSGRGARMVHCRLVPSGATPRMDRSRQRAARPAARYEPGRCALFLARPNKPNHGS